MHQITVFNDFLQFTCIISTFYDNSVRSLLVCKVFTCAKNTFYDNCIKELEIFFEMIAGNTVEICQKHEIYHEIYNMQLIA